MQISQKLNYSIGNFLNALFWMNIAGNLQNFNKTSFISCNFTNKCRALATSQFIVKKQRTKRRFNPLGIVVFQLYIVPRTGFEPMTYCLEGSCSIQLSYRGILIIFCGAKVKIKSQKTNLNELILENNYKAIDFQSMFNS